LWKNISSTHYTTYMTICFRLRDHGACRYGKMCYNSQHINPSRVCSEWKLTGWCSNFKKCLASHPPREAAAEGTVIKSAPRPAAAQETVIKPAPRAEGAVTRPMPRPSSVKKTLVRRPNSVKAAAVVKTVPEADAVTHKVEVVKQKAVDEWPLCTDKLIFGTVEKSILGESLCFNNTITQ
jgi:hypothetical protein